MPILTIIVEIFQGSELPQTFLNSTPLSKKSWKIPKEKSEAINRRTDTQNHVIGNK